jgi:spore coat polysaccharide biosynthesis predicted glycosyltransferase SpsG
MNRDPILFRVDATAKSGWERMNRCLTFAAALQRRRRPTYFLSQLEAPHLEAVIKRGGSDWLDTDQSPGTDADLRKLTQQLRRIRPAAVIVDSAQVRPKYLAELLSCGVVVVSIDDVAAFRSPVQLVINPKLSPGVESYDFQGDTQLLSGRRYALVRPEVRRMRPSRAQEPAQPFRVLVATGEDDSPSKVIEVIHTLLAISRIARIDVLARPSGVDWSALHELMNVSPERLGMAREPAEISARVSRGHVAVSTGSGWSLELACVGVPQVMTILQESNRANARRIEEEGAGLCVGGKGGANTAELRNAIQELLDDPLERQAMARCGRKLIDGRGPDRLVTALEIMLHPRPVELGAAA